MKRICYLPDVRCGTFTELVDYMDEHPELDAWRGPGRSRHRPPARRRPAGSSARRAAPEAR